MRLVGNALCAVIFLTCAATAAAAQSPVLSGAPASAEPAPATPAPTPRIWVHLTDGRRLEADEVTEGAGGVWYRRGNVSSFLAQAKVVRVEREDLTPLAAKPVIVPVAVLGNWRLSDAPKVEAFFAGKFNRRLPVTAFGQSELHRIWGFDHRNSMDVGLHPDSPEGRALVQFLRAEGIPFLTFRGPIPGVASGPHVHIGRPSNRIGTLRQTLLPTSVVR